MRASGHRARAGRIHLAQRLEIPGRETVLDYRLEALQPGHITLIGSNKTAASTDDITVRDASPNGSEVTYQASIELHGLAKLGEPVVKAAMERLGDATATQIQQAVAVL